jgi:hypothetical protein
MPGGQQIERFEQACGDEHRGRENEQNDFSRAFHRAGDGRPKAIG